MLLRKRDKSWKNGSVGISRRSGRYIYIATILVLLGITGCSNLPKTEIQTVEDRETLVREQSDYEEADEIAEIYRNIYEEAIEAKTLDSLEVIRRIVNRLGENGYVAIDSENQIDMTEAEQVMQFCEQVNAKKEAELTIIVISYSGGFTKYDLKTEEGNVDIVQGYYQYESGQLKNMSASSYRADSWQYTEGYLIFGGIWYSKENYILSLSGVEEHIALRVQPLDEKCREFNRKYIRLIGYEQNNMFLSNWTEDDFGELDFYDSYDIFYKMKNNQFSPYVADDNLGVGAIYQIPKAEFEDVIMTYFKIDSETLQSKTTYFSEDETYEYKPRGFYEIELHEIPYPEVVSYVKNSDGI